MKNRANASGALFCATHFANWENSSTFAEKFQFMEIRFGKKALQELYENGRSSDRQYRLQPQIVKRYQARVKTLENAERIEDLFIINSLHFEALHGDKEGLYSIRVNDQFRLEFTTVQVLSETVITICTVEELSNHYK